MATGKANGYGAHADIGQGSGPPAEEFEAQKAALIEKLAGKLRHHYGRTLQDATKKQLHNAFSLIVRDEIMEKFTISKEDMEYNKQKQLYYLSLEFLMGRVLGNNLINLMKTDVYSAVCESLDITLDEVLEIENDAGLGNGGLGRLAACFLDSLSTLRLNATGCGIRYEYGLFKQKIMDGYQIELPDPWLEDGNVWEVPCPDEQVEVRFGGSIAESWDDGVNTFAHTGYQTVIAVPYDIPISGYSSKVVNRLRLWHARSTNKIDMALFNSGDYVSAGKEKELAEVLSKVLYPEDNHYTGKTLRLRQQYFFVSATVQWIVRDYKRVYGMNFYRMPEYVAIHINDTHPALAIPELLRILCDEEKLHWIEAWDIVSEIFSYTNHTIMSEALERWPIAFFRDNLPRIYMIVHEINETYCRGLWERYPGDWDRIAGMAVIADGEVRMANLCVAMCKNVNGVSALHTGILKENVFADYFRDAPDKFVNVTNGVTHRRWLLHANPCLARLVSSVIGDDWILDPEKLSALAMLADDAPFQEQFAQAKRAAKQRLADYIQATSGVLIDAGSIFDVQVKRLHEYKRQLLNIIHILSLYRRIKEEAQGAKLARGAAAARGEAAAQGAAAARGEAAARRPIVFIFGAKASPGYYHAKLIIKLITSVSQFIARDPDVRDLLKVIFVENYGVSIAEKIIPAADVSEQISTAGKEASGTGNMKFMLNGAVTIGTLDGANVEMQKLVGEENIYIFGLTADETRGIYADGGYDSHAIYDADKELAAAVNMIQDGSLSPDKPRLFTDIFNSLLYSEAGMSDPYLVLKDFEPYAAAHSRLVADYGNKRSWIRKSIMNVAAAGYFSSDRAIRDYNESIWHLK